MNLSESELSSKSKDLFDKLEDGDEDVLRILGLPAKDKPTPDELLAKILDSMKICD